MRSTLATTHRYTWRFRDKGIVTGMSDFNPDNYVDLAFTQLMTDSSIAPSDPLLPHLPPPDGLADLAIAVERVLAALKNNEQIVIFADYDVDGTSSAAMLRCFFRELGHPVAVAIPHRMHDGYGLNPEAVERAHAAGMRLLITVDNGVSAHAACERARELGLDVIVTDHHDLPDTLPCALAILNPKRADCEFPYKGLAGVGVAFYLMAAIRSRLRQQGHAAAERMVLKSFLDFVALGTIADMAPLAGTNHILCKLGLEVMRENVNCGIRPGLAALLRVSGCDPLRDDITAYDIGYRLGPRLNAAGRLNSAQTAETLLSTEDPQLAQRIAAQLDAENSERQVLERSMVDEALARLANKQDLPSGIVLADEGWHPGVVGLVASRVLARHYRPTLVLGGANGLLRGSGRSIDGVDLYALLAESRHRFRAFGGHAAAVGLTILPEDLEWLQTWFAEKVASCTQNHPKRPPLSIDAEVALATLQTPFLDKLSLLEPFGQENPQPKWLVRGAKIRYLKPIGQGADANHARILVEQGSMESWLTAFSLRRELAVAGAKETPLDLVVEAGMRSWRGSRRPEIRLIDFAVSSRHGHESSRLV